MFVSTAGFGRNATLMVFHDLKRRIAEDEITTEETLDNSLKWAINTGRIMRGPRFVHSDEQVALLRRALLEVLQSPGGRQSGQSEPPNQDGARPANSSASQRPSVPGSVSVPAAGQVPNRVAVPAQPPAQAQAQVQAPAPVQVQVPVQAPAEVPAEVPAQVPAQVPAPAPAQIPEQPQSREQTGATLMRALQRAASTKMDEFATLDATRSRTEAQENLHRQLRYDIGERLRLQHVLQNFLRAPPLRIPIDHSPTKRALDECYPRQRAAGDALKGNTAAQPSGSDNANPAAFSMEQCKADETWAKEHMDACAWLTRFELKPVKNGGADNKTEHDEGNNCLIVALLQHATGDYGNRFHRDMAKILREALVARFGTQLLDQGSTGSPYLAMLLSDSTAGKSLVPMINALYGCKLEPHWLSMRRVDNALVEEVSNDIDDDKREADAEPVLIYQSSTHFEAMVSKNIVPVSQPDLLSSVEEEIGVAVGEIARSGGRFDELKAQIEAYKKMIEKQIEAENNKFDAEEKYPLLGNGADINQQHRAHFAAIGDEHCRARRDKETKLLKERFNNAIHFWQLSLEGRITKADHDFIDSTKFAINANAASLRSEVLKSRRPSAWRRSLGRLHRP